MIGSSEPEEKVVCKIDMKLPSLNDYINVCRRNRFESASYKKKLERKIGSYMDNMPVFNNPIRIHFHWIEGNKRRDLDNICFSKKFILDAMVKLGKLKDDNRNCVTAFTDSFEYGEETCVILFIEEEKNGRKENVC